MARPRKSAVPLRSAQSVCASVRSDPHRQDRHLHCFRPRAPPGRRTGPTHLLLHQQQHRHHVQAHVAASVRPGGQVWRPQLPLAARGPVQGRRCVRVGRGRQALPGLPERLLRRQPGPLPPQDPGRPQRAGLQADAVLARLLLGCPGRVPADDERAVRLPAPAAHEHGRGGRRDGVQAGAPLGLRQEGHPGEQGQDHLRRGQLLGPHPGRRLLVHGQGQLRRLRPLHARLRPGALQRPGRARGGAAGPRGVRLHGGADPGRGGRGGAARRLPQGRARAVHAPQRAVDRGRGADGAGPHGPPARRAPRGGQARHRHPGQGAVRRRVPRVRRAGRRRRHAVRQARPARLHVRRQPAGLPRGHGRPARAARRAADGERGAHGRPAARRAGQAAQGGGDAGARQGAAQRHRHRQGHRRVGGVPQAARQRAAGQAHPRRHHPAGAAPRHHRGADPRGRGHHQEHHLVLRQELS